MSNQQLRSYSLARENDDGIEHDSEAAASFVSRAVDSYDDE